MQDTRSNRSSHEGNQLTPSHAKQLFTVEFYLPRNPPKPPSREGPARPLPPDGGEIILPPDGGIISLRSDGCAIALRSLGGVISLPLEEGALPWLKIVCSPRGMPVDKRTKKDTEPTNRDNRNQAAERNMSPQVALDRRNNCLLLPG